MPDIFLSYSRDDQVRAKLFAEAFAREGFEVWWDVGLRAGEAYDAVTEQALRDAKAVVVLWSRRSVASRWVRAEATIALRSNTLVPVTIEPCERPIMFELTHTAELTHWTGDAADPAFRSFIDGLRGFVAHGTATKATTSAAASGGDNVSSSRLAAGLKGLSRRQVRLPILVALIGAVGLAALGFAISRTLQPTTGSATTRVAQVDINLPAGYVIGPGLLEPVAISHDGTRLAFVALKDDKSALFVRALDEPDAKRLDGTDGADAPFFSPDDRWIGFFAGGKLRKVPVGGGAAQVLADANFPRGGDWSDDGYIYFAPTNSGSIWRIPEAGGTPTEVTQLDAGKGEVSHRWPHRIRGTDTLLFSAWTGPGDDEARLAVQSVGTAGHRWLVEGNRPRYDARAEVLAYRYGSQFLTVPWNPSQADFGKAAPTQAAVQPTDGGRNEGTGNFAFAENGTLVYLRTAESLSAAQLSWVDRAGKSTPLPLPQRKYENVAVSPDGSRAVLQIREGTTRLWVYDFVRSTLTPLPTGPGSSQAPVWSADSRHIFYRGTRQGTRNLYRIAADGSGEEERLTSKPGVVQTPISVSKDGQILLYNENGPTERFEAGAWMLPLAANQQARRLFPAAVDAANAHLSPDGRWVAYEARVASRAEIFVAPFGGDGERRLISTDGGEQPLWSRDGRELFFNSPRGLMVVDIGVAGKLAPSSPRLLLAGPFTIRQVNNNTMYGIAPDGSRFLRIQSVAQNQNIRDIELVFNWLEAR
jgi:serine/threonine-protein kinase